MYCICYNYNMKIIPAILEKDYLKVKDTLETFSKVATTIQIDVVENSFVAKENTSENKEIDNSKKGDREVVLDTWLPNSYEDINGYNLNLEFDMMVSDIEKYLDMLYHYDAKKIIIHTRDMNIVDYMNVYEKIKERNHFVQVGICDTDTEKIKATYGYYDYVQLMGIENIGAQGQGFDTNVIDKIKLVKEFLDNKKEDGSVSANKNILDGALSQKEIYIQIDGAMNPENIKLCKDAGAVSFAVGSYFKNAIKNNNLKEVYTELKSI